MFDIGGFSNKDLYQHLWEGRNFELSHFWHRSVFLTGIFVVLLAGYGKVIFAIGAGMLTMLIRVSGNLPEGVVFSIVIMNLVMSVL